MTVLFESTTHIEAPIARVFDLALSIDLHLASMRRSRERAIGGVTEGTIGLDETVTWRAWHFGIPWTMTSRITELERPTRFTDEQVRGPFKRFHHEHRFETVDNGTRMVDSISFDAPAGALGRLVEWGFLSRYLRQLISTRNEFLKGEAEAKEPAT